MTQEKTMQCEDAAEDLSDPQFQAKDGVQKAESPTPVTGKLSEQRQKEETLAWLKRINKGMKRMTEDEAYRLEIAKNLS